MRVCCTSDFHWEAPPPVPECDLLLLAGDVLDGDLDRLAAWLRKAPAGEIVGIAGNHDRLAYEQPGTVRALPWTYLCNEAAVVAGVKVFGSPMSMPFGGWDFMAPEHELQKVWETIPDDTEILMVHGPADGILDLAGGGKHTGSRTLRKRLRHLPRLRLLVTGHIHEAYGRTALPGPVDGDGRLRWVEAVNASHVDGSYRPVNPPIVVELDREETSS